ncbi:MAG: tryptophan-rich sensory protein [Pedobacter sp.]|nr:tryptophan-rich sensory protein [Chitinophagaceae bacterium]
MEKSNILKLITCLIFTVGLGGASGFFTVSEIAKWYVTLNKPSFNPPNYLFGPVWTVLYILIGISLYLIWKQPPNPQRKKAIIVFLIQFAINISWSFIFFNQHQILLALVDIVAMWLFIIFTIIIFSKISKAAAWLLVPYLFWVSFAVILNSAIWILNK